MGHYSFILNHSRAHFWRIFAAIFASVTSAGSIVAFGLVIGDIVDVKISSYIESMHFSILSILLITIAMSSSSFIRMYFLGTYADKVADSIRKDLYNHAIKLNPDFFTGINSSASSLIINDIANLQSIIGGTFNHVMRTTFAITFSLGMLVFSNSMLTLYTTLILGACIAPIIYLGKKCKGTSKIVKSMFDRLESFTLERCQSISIVQAFAQEKYEKKLFEKKSESLLKASEKNSLFRSMLVSFIIAEVMLSFSIVIMIGLRDVGSGLITSGEFASFLFYVFICISSVGHLGDLSSDLQKVNRIFEKIKEFMAIKPNITEIQNPLPIEKFTESIEFKDVEFSYNSGVKAISKVSFSVKKGKIFSIVGKSGSGKSTLLKLLMRFYDIDNGSICFDKKNIKDLNLHNLRSLFGFVPQSCKLFSCSILENISYGSPDSTFEEIKKAADLAYCTEFIEKLPDGFHSVIGDDSMNLSGGQTQRILIARAILKNPEILILDEATSSLDSESDYFVRSALSNLMKERTTIVIAHRLSTVSGSDTIMLMHEGKIESIGNHNQLLKTSSMYKNFVEMQFLDYEQ